MSNYFEIAKYIPPTFVNSLCNSHEEFFCFDQYEGYFPLDGVTNIEVKPKNNELHMIKCNKDRKIILKMLNPQLIDIWVTSFKKAMKVWIPLCIYTVPLIQSRD